MLSAEDIRRHSGQAKREPESSGPLDGPGSLNSCFRRNDLRKTTAPEASKGARPERTLSIQHPVLSTQYSTNHLEELCLADYYDAQRSGFVELRSGILACQHEIGFLAHRSCHATSVLLDQRRGLLA